MYDVDNITNIKESYLSAIIAGDSLEATLIVDTALARGVALLSLYRDIFWESQKQLGALWEEGRINVAQEHLATGITVDQMARLRSRIKPHSEHRYRVVVTTCPGDNHNLGARMVADFLLIDGWEVDFLGSETPFQDLIVFLLARRPALLAFSIGLPELLPSLRQGIMQIREAGCITKIMVGGRAITLEPTLAETLAADAVATDLADAAAVSRQLVGLNRQHITLEAVLKSLGRKIQLARQHAKLSQKELGAHSGLDRAYISGLENGRQNISIANLWKISQVLGVPIGELLVGGTGFEPVTPPV